MLKRVLLITVTAIMINLPIIVNAQNSTATEHLKGNKYIKQDGKWKMEDNSKLYNIITNIE